jgi:hypothetical protein
MTGFKSKRQAAQDKMELADAYASAVAATPHMPTPLERNIAVERIERARNALEAALEQQQDKLTDEADTLTIVYQRGFADGKRSAQRKPLTDELVYKLWDDKYRSWIGGEQFESIARAVEAKLKERNT